MLIAVDIGNTYTTAVLLEEGDGAGQSLPEAGKFKIIRARSVRTDTGRIYEKEAVRAFKMVSGKGRRSSSGKTPGDVRVVVCSVVPRALASVKRCVKEVFQTRAEVVGKDVRVPILNMYDNPQQVGQDRLVCAFAAAELYGYPAVVVDLGTAITFDVVSSRKEYLGGIIAPGIRLSAETLFHQTALLPRVLIRRPEQLIGKNTQESILSGMFYGYGEMIKGVTDLLVKELKAQPKIVVTGGFSDVMKNYIADDQCLVDKDLIFKGIYLIADCRGRGELV